MSCESCSDQRLLLLGAATRKQSSVQLALLSGSRLRGCRADFYRLLQLWVSFQQALALAAQQSLAR